MDLSYRGTIDFEGETLEQCIHELHETMQGKYGSFIPTGSLLIEKDEIVVSAILTTLWKGHPLVAYTMTDPTYQRLGLAKFLLRKAITNLHKSGFKNLFLVVTEGNISAETLYESGGFERAGTALPGAPPPMKSHCENLP